MARKRDFSSIGSSLLAKNDKPSSLSELLSGESNSGDEAHKAAGLKIEQIETTSSKKSDVIIRECISISKSDADMVNDLAIKCATEGQRASKADIYRASIRYFSKLSPTVMASKIREVRKDKKTHN